MLWSQHRCHKDLFAPSSAQLTRLIGIPALRISLRPLCVVYVKMRAFDIVQLLCDICQTGGIEELPLKQVVETMLGAEHGALLLPLLNPRTEIAPFVVSAQPAAQDDSPSAQYSPCMMAAFTASLLEAIDTALMTSDAADKPVLAFTVFPVVSWQSGK